MSPLALIAKAFGYQVQGSDPESNYLTDILTAQNIKIFSQQCAANVQDVGTIIYSSAIKETNPEFAAAEGRCRMHRSDLLRHFLEQQFAVTVAGTHGKTTTTAMIAHMLECLGQNPVAAVGGMLQGYKTPALTGNGSIMVAEADESDGTFLKYHPNIGVLTSVDQDHLDYYHSLDELMEASLQHLKHIDAEGIAVVNWDDRGSREVGSLYTGERLTYGFRLGADIRGMNFQAYHDYLTFDAMVEKDRVTCRVPAIGKHNANNALGVLAVARALKLNIQDAAESLASFPGVKRRMSLTYSSAMVRVYDDYAHNPGKIAACLAGVREAFPEFKILAYFQPHRYSRLKTMYPDFLKAFQDCDQLTIFPVFAAGESVDPQFSLTTMTQDFLNAGRIPTVSASSFSDCLGKLEKVPSHPQVHITIGAGDVWKLSELIRDFYEKT